MKPAPHRLSPRSVSLHPLRSSRLPSSFRRSSPPSLLLCAALIFILSGVLAAPSFAAANSSSQAQMLPSSGRILLPSAPATFLNTLAGPGALSDGLTPPIPPCEQDETTLCLQGGALEVTMSYRNQRTGEEGRAKVTAMGDRTGLFWFFREDNVEAVIKILDATNINGHYWAYIGSLTDLEFEITVFNTQSIQEVVYRNEPGNRYGIADDRALPTSEGSLCGTIQGLTCPGLYVCEFEAGRCDTADLSGVCLLRPAVCPTDFEPVCGCDGRTYSNDCERLRTGVAKDSDGLCE